MRFIKYIGSMKKWLLFVGLCWILNLNAQTGIGTSTPNASAKLDVSSSNKGFLPPRISLTDISDQTTIPSPATGLLVYCKGDAGLAAGYYFWNGNAWATIATAGGSGSFTSSYLRGSRTAIQTIAVGGVVTFTNIDNSAGSDISLNTSTGKITLAAGNTYRLRGAVPNFSGGQRPAFMWYNETTSSNIGSGTFAYNPGDAAALGAFGAPAEVVITPNISTVVSLRLLSSLSSGSVTVGANADFSTSGSYPWFDIQVISGNAPITGQSVDYGIARYTGADGSALSVGALVGFDVTASGNLIWSGNKFILKANKTYELESSLAIHNSSAGTAGIFQIFDYTNSISLGNSLFMSQNGTGTKNQNANTPIKCIITPTTDIQVGIKLSDFYGGAPGIIGNAVATGSNSAANTSYFMVKQIGSSAIINPWILSGTNTYNTTGNVGIGTNSPTVPLEVNGAINAGTLNLSNISTNPSISIKNGDAAAAYSDNAQIKMGWAGSAAGTSQYAQFIHTRHNAGTTENAIDFYLSNGTANNTITSGSTKAMSISSPGNLDVAGKITFGDASGNVALKVSAFKSSGSYISMDNLKATVIVSNNYGGVSIAAVSTTFNALISGSYSMYNLTTGGGAANANQSITTTPTGMLFGWSFPTAGDTATFLITDNTNSRVYRLIVQINYSFLNNFMSIERLI
jgi:hypothetical protein